MATARDLIKSALRKIHVLGKGASLDPDEADDALNLLNQMLATWSADGDMIFTESKETFSLSTPQTSYTIGSGGDFDTVRPLYLSASFVTQGTTDYPLRVIDNQEYAKIPQKNIGNIPDVIYYDAGYPLAKIYLYPKPSGVSTLTLYSFKPLTSFATLDTTFAMPDEYETALIYNLAEWIGPEYEREASPTVKRIAQESKDAVMSQNRRNEFFLSVTNVPADRRTNAGDIYEGWYT